MTDGMLFREYVHDTIDLVMARNPDPPQNHGRPSFEPL